MNPATLMVLPGIQFVRTLCFSLAVATGLALAPEAYSDQSLDSRSRLASVMQDVRKKYPRVAQLDTRRLVSWMQDATRARPVILDVRERAEFEVSHLPGAHRAISADAALTVVGELPRDTPIVAYCAVGYRSSALAQELIERGYTNVYNLEGSIFEWANRGYPVVRDGREVREVHPYNWWWGQYLHESLRAR